MKLAMTDDEFDVLRRILEKTTGLVHDATRRDSLNFSVVSRVEATGVRSVAAYLALLAGPHGEAERQKLIDVVTIQETHFFRNSPQIRALRQHVLPELIRRAVAANRPLRIWSAGCSTGEEPYSVAMLVRELLPMATREHVQILGSDISNSAIEFAQSARYGARSVQMAEPVDLARWFTIENDSYVVRDDVRELVEFRLHNLVADEMPFEAHEVDLLLCRNVTIYFNRTTTKELMARFHYVLSNGGYLFLGHSETLWQMSDAFTLVPLGDAFVYRRDDRAERRSVLPDRRTEPGDAPILLRERRARADRRNLRSERAAGSDAAHQRAAGSDAAHQRAAGPDAVHQPGASEHAATARLALAAGRYGDAVIAAARAVRGDPMLVDPHLVAGEALVNLGRDGDAVKELRQAVYLKADCAPAHLLLAGALDRLGESAAAGRAYRAAAATVSEMTPDEVTVFFGGRDSAELVQLCIRLAMQAERAARAEGMRHTKGREAR